MKPATQCCCGCSLKTGVIIIAVLYLISAIDFSFKPFRVDDAISHSLAYDNQPKSDLDWDKLFESSPAYVEVSGSCFAIIMTVLLWLGIHTDNHMFFIVFVYLKLFFISIVTFGAVIGFFIVAYFFKFYALLVVLVYFLFMGLPLYFTWIVWSHAEQIRTARQQPIALQTF